MTPLDPAGRDGADSADDPLDDVLDAAAELSDLDAARAEAWASGLLAEWPDHDDLVDALRQSTRPEAIAVAVALRPMLPAVEAVIDELVQRGVTVPGFASAVGTAAPLAAWSIRDPRGGGQSIVLEYEHADGVRHDLLVEIDGALAVDLLVGPPGVVEAAAEEDDRPFEVRPIDVHAAAATIRAALEATARTPGVPLTDAFLLNHGLVASRLGLPIATPAPDPRADDRPWREADPEGDALARATLVAALGEPSTDQVAIAPARTAAATLRARHARRESDALALAAEAGITDVDEVDDITLLVRIAAAYVVSGPRAGLSPAAADAIDGLESVDWLGAVLPLVRGGIGASADPEQLVRNINRCPEVTTSIPKRDAPAVASAFGAALPAWRCSGAIDELDQLTELGVGLLPLALAAAWGGEI